MRASWGPAALALALLAAPAGAHAATASISQATLTYQAAAGEANRVTVIRAPSAFRISDAGAPVVAGAGCTATGSNAVECPANGIRGLVVRVGDGDDVVTTSVTTTTVVTGGPDNDRLEGGEGEDDLRGGPGDDVLEGGDGSDVVNGGPGADRLSGGIEQGGAFEFDAAVYGSRTAPVRVSLDDVANDGEVGEGDNVLRDVELIVGGAGNDVLRGNDRVLNAFLGGDGNDVILAGGGQVDAVFGERGNDLLVGGAGTDGIFGESGDDTLVAGSGDDVVDGGGGDDVLRAGAGRDDLAGGRGHDRLSGGAGADTFTARDGMRDALVGGPGWDRALVDARDRALWVEVLRRPGGEAPGVGAPLTGRTAEGGSPLARLSACVERFAGSPER